MIPNPFLGVPELRLSEKEKYEDNYAWFKKNMEYHIPIGTLTTYLNEAQLKMLNNYKYLNNNFDYEEWADVCGELGITEEMFGRNFFNVNIIPVIVNYLKTTELKRNDTYTPVLMTQQAMIKKDEELSESVGKYVDAQIEAVLKSMTKYNELLMQLQQATPEQQAQIEQQVQQMHDDIASKHTLPIADGFLSELEILASKVIQYATLNNKVKYKKVKNDAFEDVILNDGEIIKITNTYEGLQFKRINLPYFLCHKSPDIEYVQNGMWAAYTEMFSPYQLKLEFPEIKDDEWALIGLASHNIQNPTEDIRTKHHDKFPEWDLQMLATNGIAGYDPDRGYGWGQLPHLHRERLIPVTHFEFIAFKQLGMLKTMDNLGDTVTEFVDESFAVPAGAKAEKTINQWGYENTVYYFEGGSVEWIWVPWVYEVTRIGLNFYTKQREVPLQSVNVDNPFYKELSYYGKWFSQYNSKPISTFERLKPYNVMYLVIFNKLLQLTERWDGYLIPLDLSAIPLELGGGDPHEALNKFFKLRKDGYLVQNSFNEDTKQTRPAPTIIPADIGQTFSVLMNLMNWIKTEMGLIVGVSPQALSQMISSNVTDNQQAIAQTSYMIDPLFQQHNWVWQEVMTGYVNRFVEWAKDKLINSEDGQHRLSYVLGESTKQALLMKPENLDLAFFGVNVNNSNPKEYYDFMIQQSQAMVQNQLISEVELSSIILSMQAGESPYELHKKFIEAKQRREERDEQMQAQQERVAQMQEKSKKDLLQMQKDMINLKEQWEEVHIKSKGEIELQKESMHVYINQETLDADGNGIPDPIEAAKIQQADRKLTIEQMRAQTEARSQSWEEQSKLIDVMENEKDRKTDLQKESIKARKRTNSK